MCLFAQSDWAFFYHVFLTLICCGFVGMRYRPSDVEYPRNLRMCIKYECLKRTRLAKHEVLERLFQRKIGDGKWCGLGEGESRKNKIKYAVSIFNQLRGRYQTKNILKDNGTPKLNQHFPELDVGYDYRNSVHVIKINVNT